MSFIAFELDALNVVPDVAAASGLTPGEVAHGLLKLWAWCFRGKTNIVTTTHLAGFFGGKEAAPALNAFGFLEPSGDGLTWRVKGAEKYLNVSKQRSEAGKARSSSAGRSAGRFTSTTPAADQRATSGGPALTPSTEHLTPNTTTYVRDEGCSVPASERPTHLAILEAPDTPPEGWTADDFFAWYQAERVEGVDGLPQEKPPHPRRMSTWWAVARGQCSVEQLQAAAHRYGSDPYWRRAVPPVPFNGFMSQWDRFIAEEARNVG